MRVNVDLSEIVVLGTRANAEVDELPQELLRCVEMGAAFERHQHEYQNQTGDLEKSTKAVIDQTSRSRAQVTLEMGMDYASYVKRRGLSEVESASVRARDEFQAWADDMADRIYK